MRVIRLVLIAFTFFATVATTPVAKADIEIPTCWPCGR